MANFKICMGNDCLSLCRCRKKCRHLGRWNCLISMNNLLLILLLSFGEYSEARFIHKNKAEVSKVDYSSKANSSNVHYFALPIETVDNFKQGISVNVEDLSDYCKLG